MINQIKKIRIMITLFENSDFTLLLTGHDYDFVGIIETKTTAPLTFFFSEELFSADQDDFDDTEADVDESQTRLLDVYCGLKPYDPDTGDPFNDEDEEQDIAMDLGATSWMRTRDDKSTGFLSDPKERGQFLALVKAYCPERIADIPWAA